ncbi:MAG: thymidylate synthase [Candidatus Gracilibacteria bacterium]|nr:thymidylate synthase [Candidatus Gracilibacteria bacterium]
MNFYSTLGDAHIYNNHIEQVGITTLKISLKIMTIKNINKDIKTLEDIENLEWEDFELINYNLINQISSVAVLKNIETFIKNKSRHRT